MSTTTYTILADRFSPEPDVMTADEFRAYCAEMNETSGWEIDLDAIDVRDDGIYCCGEMVAPIRRVSTLSDLTANMGDEERVEFNRALLEDMYSRPPASCATTEINGGDTLTFVDDDEQPMTVAQVRGEAAMFLADEGER